jgi:hypothetical protein
MTILNEFNGETAVTPDTHDHYFTADVFARFTQRLREAEEKYVGKRFSFWGKEGTIKAVVGSEPGLILWLIIVYDDKYEGKYLLQRMDHSLFHILEDNNGDD